MKTLWKHPLREKRLGEHDPSHGPEITSSSSFSVAEGTTDVATLSATDKDTLATDLTWSISSGADGTHFSMTTAGVLSFVAPKDYEAPDDADTDGVYEVVMEVSDGGRTDTAYLTVTLTNVNEAPTADAGADQKNVAQGATVTLTGSGADRDAGEVLTYAWSQTGTPEVTLSDAAAASPTFTAPTGLTADTSLTFTLRVTDDEGMYADDSVTVTISGQSAITPLTASTHDVPANHDGLTTFTFELRFSETPKRLFSYKTLWYHAFTVTGGEVVHVRRLERGRNVRWEISVRPDGNGAVTIVLPATTDCEADGAVCTDDGRKLSQGFELTVPGISGPEITSGSSFSVEEGETEVGTLTATDEDTQAADLAWSIFGGADRSKFSMTRAGVLSFAAPKDYEAPDDADTDGVYEVTVQVSDGGRTDSADLTATLTNVNEAPTADVGSDQADVEQGATVTLSGSGTDPDSGDTLSYAWTQSGTPAVTLSDSAVASPTFTAPTGLSADTALTFTLRVTDDEGMYAEDSVTVTIEGQETPSPLTASVSGMPASHDGSASFTFEVRFSETPRKGFSYKTMRDHAFTVAGGEVAKARRLEKGKNVRWEISVTPDGNGPVTIVLPVSTDCTAQGAICTQDGRMLSNRLEITVPGPGG